MDALEILTRKIQLAANELLKLKKERRGFLSEIETLRAQLDQTHKILKETEAARRYQERIRGRLEKISRKIERHLMSDSAMAMNGGERT